MKRGFLFGILFIVFSGFVSAHWGDDFYSHHYGMTDSWNYGMFGMGFFGGIISWLIIAVLILLVVYLVRKIQEQNKSQRMSKR